jgi:DegV family protein with EDD domain
VTATAAGITYLDGPRLRRSVLAAADWVDAGREELNRINVFPVPDGDTGTNFAMTLRAAAEAVRALHNSATLPAVTRAMADACVFGARGNSGMLLSHFLLGFRESLGDLEVASAPDVARAIRAGANQLYESLDEPVEGTILTVSRDAADAAEIAAGRSHNLQEMMVHVMRRAEDSLRRTPELLEVLREAGVVDAGAKAFVRVLEGVMRLIEGDPILPAAEPVQYTVPDAAALAQVAAEQDYGYCTEVLVRGSGFPPSTELRKTLRGLGGSIVVLATDDLLKVHVHTDTPQEVFALAETWGTIESTKADDMREQHRALHEAHRKIGIVLDSSCDLPDKLVDQHGMVVVPLQVIQDETTYLDRLEIGGSKLYDRMRDGEIFTTSQPTPGAFVRAYEDALSSADQVLGVFLAGSLSGTLASAQAAAKARDSGDRVTLFDSRTASFGLGMLAIRAAELADAGWEIPAIVQELDRIRNQSGAFFTVDVFDNLLRSGRVSRGRAWLGGLLDIKPILEVSLDGRVVPLDRVRGSEALVPRVLRHLDRRLTPRPESLRIAVAHAGVPDVAEQIHQEVVSRYQPRNTYVSDVTAALGVHVGLGAWGVFWQVEDAAPPEAAEPFPANSTPQA